MKATGGFSKKALKRRKGKSPNNGLMRTVSTFIPKDKSITDIGAGIGQYVQAFRDEGYESFGVDGSEGVEEATNGLVRFLDLSKPIQWSDEQFFRSDWGFFIEVGEHIPKEFEHIVIENVNKLAKEGLIMTWAVPGQRGRGHVNCQPPEYIASEFMKLGWKLDEDGTKLGRELCKRFHKNRLLIMRK